MADQKKVTSSMRKGARKGKPSESSVFLHIFTQYAHSIAALREFFSRLNPLVVEIEKGIIRERKAYLDEIFNDFKRDAKPEDMQELENFVKALGTFPTKTSKATKSMSIEIKSPLVNQYFTKMLKLFSHYRSEDIHHGLLNRSILMSLVSYFEVLIADLVHAFYRIAPDAALTEDKTLTVKELKKFSTIDEALQSIISDAVDDLLRASVSDWHKFFQTRVRINMQLLTPDWAQWNEYFQRRHIMVHAGGRVTERYLSNVDWEKLGAKISQPSMGDELDVEDAYLENAINAFEITGLLSCQEVWRKLVPSDITRYDNPITGEGLLDAVYRRLLSRHWYVAERLATWGEEDPEASEDAMLVCKFNRWLCIKRQGRWTDVEGEVKAFDCSAKNRRYALVRASLLERPDEFFELLPKVLGTDIDIKSLKEWPILDKMRTDPRFTKAVKKAERKRETKQ